MPGEVSSDHPLAALDEDERQELAGHVKAREAIAHCLADVEEHPDEHAYALADDVLLALHNAGVSVLFRR